MTIGKGLLTVICLTCVCEGFSVSFTFATQTGGILSPIYFAACNIKCWHYCMLDIEQKKFFVMQVTEKETEEKNCDVRLPRLTGNRMDEYCFWS